MTRLLVFVACVVLLSSAVPRAVAQEGPPDQCFLDGAEIVCPPEDACFDDKGRVVDCAALNVICQTGCGCVMLECNYTRCWWIPGVIQICNTVVRPCCSCAGTPCN